MRPSVRRGLARPRCTTKYSGESSRHGTAVVELSLCLPLLFLIALGSVEACNVIHLQQCLTEASFEGAMAGSMPNVDEQTVINRMTTMLDAHGFTGATFEVVGTSGTPFNDLNPGDTFRVTASITPSNSMVVQLINEYSEFSASRVARKQ